MRQERAERWAARERAWRLLYPEAKPSRMATRAAHIVLDLVAALGFRGEQRRIERINRELGDS
ncbi:hypothetical protein [Nocardia wallacei]|uniref:hypothetical protein n=1 Tax=Nocardia wallacei TaxID=480035 RepID=UPI00245802B1|nr:hypothetical protein [Nocardia wallacei]